MSRRFPFAALLLMLWLLLPAPVLAKDASADAVHVRVADVGAGLCTVTSIPGGHYMAQFRGRLT